MGLQPCCDRCDLELQVSSLAFPLLHVHCDRILEPVHVVDGAVHAQLHLELDLLAEDLHDLLLLLVPLFHGGLHLLADVSHDVFFLLERGLLPFDHIDDGSLALKLLCLGSLEIFGV